jgi:anti-sigma regulatory factor (Ser/Thr protein kinase)
VTQKHGTGVEAGGTPGRRQVAGASIPGLVMALAFVAGCYAAAALLSPRPLYGVQPTFGISLNAGVIGALSVLPSRRRLPAFLAVVGVLSVGVWRPEDMATLRLALLITAANLPTVWLFRALMIRFAAGGREPDARRYLLGLLGCGVIGVAFNAVAAAGLFAVATSAGWLPASLVPSGTFLFGVRPAAQLDGIVTITPLIFMLMFGRPGAWPWRTWTEIGCWLTVVITVCSVAIRLGDEVPVSPLLLGLSFAALVFAVLRLGSLAAAVLSPAFGVLAAAVLLAAGGPGAPEPGLSTVLWSQLAGFLAAVLAWAVSTVVTERDEARRLAQADAAAQVALTSLQTALLPRVVTSGPGLMITVRYRAAGAFDQIGGDWYDTIALPCGGTALVIGDVEGHDLTAASVMGLVRGAVRSYALEGHPPSMVLERVSSFLVSAGTDRLVTMVYAQLYPQDTLVTVAVGGHPPPMVVPGRGQARLLDVRAGPILGVEGLGRWPEETVRLPSDATLVLYTDGLTDFPAASGDQRERILALAAGVGHEPVDVIADTLIASAPPYDDAAVLAARPAAGAAPFAQRVFPVLPVSVSIARVWLGDLFRLWQAAGRLGGEIQDLVEVAQLLLSELMTNAVRHGDAAVQARLFLRGRRLRVEVADTSERMPVMSGSTSDVDAGGRGLLLVDALSDGWGVRLDERGKVVWFELCLRRPSLDDPSPDAASLISIELRYYR